MTHDTLIDTATLARHLGDPAWRVFDCRHDLADPQLGARQYAEGHIPGARFAHLDHDLSAPKNGRNGRHPAPSREAIVDWLGRQGVRPGDQVIAYDAAGGTMAARLWWTLRRVGHSAVAVLDGGYKRWLAETRPVSTEVPRIAATRYGATLPADTLVDATEVEARLQAADRVLVDARTAERYRGEAEPIDPVAGRIPGSRNRFCGLNLQGDGRFKAPEALREEFAELLGGADPVQVVHSCGSGVAACHNLLAMEIAGLPGSRVYAGSWSEWCADPRRPRETG